VHFCTRIRVRIRVRLRLRIRLSSCLHACLHIIPSGEDNHVMRQLEYEDGRQHRRRNPSPPSPAPRHHTAGYHVNATPGGGGFNWFSATRFRPWRRSYPSFSSCPPRTPLLKPANPVPKCGRAKIPLLNSATRAARPVTLFSAPLSCPVPLLVRWNRAQYDFALPLSANS
jgi:hypothetical protein